MILYYEYFNIFNEVLTLSAPCAHLFRFISGAKRTTGSSRVARAARTATATPSARPPRLATSTPANAPASPASEVAAATDARRTTGETREWSATHATVTPWDHRAISVTTRLGNASVWRVMANFKFAIHIDFVSFAAIPNNHLFQLLLTNYHIFGDGGIVSCFSLIVN